MPGVFGSEGSAGGVSVQREHPTTQVCPTPAKQPGPTWPQGSLSPHLALPTIPTWPWEPGGLVAFPPALGV